MSDDRQVIVKSHHVRAGEINFHCLTAGAGKQDIVLLHGWPQSSHEWHRLIPYLTDDFSIYAPDLPGIGGSRGIPCDFSTQAIAGHIDAFIQELHLFDVILVGHDIGGMVAYAYAKNYADVLRGLVIIDAPLPGVRPWPLVKNDPRSWHFGFHQSTVTETLVAGHQEVYFRSFDDKLARHPEAIRPDAEKVYAQADASPESLRSGFEYYRAFPEDDRQNTIQAKIPVAVPTLIVSGEFGMGVFGQEPINGLIENNFTNARHVVVNDAAHWIPEEQPEELAAQIRNLAIFPS